MTGTPREQALAFTPTSVSLLLVSFVVLLYVIELFDSLSGHHLDDNGIRPLEADGLPGVLFAPLLHSNWQHLMANTGPALILNGDKLVGQGLMTYTAVGADVDLANFTEHDLAQMRTTRQIISALSPYAQTVAGA